MKTLQERVEASLLTIGALAVAASVQISAAPARPAATVHKPVAAAADRTIPDRDRRARDLLCLIELETSPPCIGRPAVSVPAAAPAPIARR